MKYSLRTTNPNTKNKLRYTSIALHRKHRQENSPKMAKRLELKTMNGSRVTPKTAGIESTYKNKIVSTFHAKLTGKFHKK